MVSRGAGSAFAPRSIPSRGTLVFDARAFHLHGNIEESDVSRLSVLQSGGAAKGGSWLRRGRDVFSSHVTVLRVSRRWVVAVGGLVWAAVPRI